MSTIICWYNLNDTVAPYLKEVFVVCMYMYDKRVMNENKELFEFTWQYISFDDWILNTSLLTWLIN